MRFYWLFLGVLSVWRVTHLLQAEDGPWDLVASLRKMAGRRFFGKLLDCFYCLSIWISLPLAYALGENLKEQFLLWPSLSAGAIFFERITARGHEPKPAVYFEDEEEEDVMLRESEGEVSDDNSAPAQPRRPGA